MLLRGALILMLAFLTSCFTGKLKSRGTLVADIGMTFDEVIRKSTLKLKPPYHMKDGTIRDTQEDVFDYRIGDSGMVFPLSRYYWLVTRKHDPERIEEINIGITPEKMPMSELQRFQRKLQEQLDADGWMAGHYIAKSEEVERLWGGKKTSGDGRYWARNNTLLIFETNRMDEQKRDELPGSGEYILYIDLRPKSDHADLVFERSAWTK